MVFCCNKRERNGISFKLARNVFFSLNQQATVVVMRPVFFTDLNSAKCFFWLVQGFEGLPLDLLLGDIFQFHVVYSISVHSADMLVPLSSTLGVLFLFIPPKEWLIYRMEFSKLGSIIKYTIYCKKVDIG